MTEPDKAVMQQALDALVGADEIDTDMKAAIDNLRAAIAQPVEPTIKESLKVHASAEDYLRNKYSAYRWQFAQQDLEEAYSQGRYDEKMAQGPSPWPDEKSVNIAQPVESDDLTIAYMSGLTDGKKAAQPARVPETDCGNIVQTNLQALVHKVHAAKGRYHSQIAMCDLYDACGLTNVRPGVETKETK